MHGTGEQARTHTGTCILCICITACAAATSAVCGCSGGLLTQPATHLYQVPVDLPDFKPCSLGCLHSFQPGVLQQVLDTLDVSGEPQEIISLFRFKGGVATGGVGVVMGIAWAFRR